MTLPITITITTTTKLSRATESKLHFTTNTHHNNLAQVIPMGCNCIHLGLHHPTARESLVRASSLDSRQHVESSTGHHHLVFRLNQLPLRSSHASGSCAGKRLGRLMSPNEESLAAKLNSRARSLGCTTAPFVPLSAHSLAFPSRGTCPSPVEGRGTHGQWRAHTQKRTI